MRKPFLFFLVSSISFHPAVHLSGCGGGQKAGSACEGVVCQEWEECRAGACVPLQGRCNDYTDCAENMFCAQDHACVGPESPDPSFFEPVATNCVTFGYRGLVNSEEDIQGSSPTLGIGEYEWQFDGGSETLTEYAYSYRWTVPEDYYDPELRGLEAMVMGVSRQLDSAMNQAHYYHISAVFPVEAFREMAGLGIQETSLPEPVRFAMYEIVNTLREWDRAQYRKVCLLAEADPSNGESGLFLNHFNNHTFDPGEDLLLWGNIAMTPRNVITEQNEETLCGFTVNGRPISRDDYLTGISQDEPTLSCDVPAGFFDAATTRSATFFFIGNINDPDVGLSNFLTGTGELEIRLDGNEVVADDYYTLAYRWTVFPTDVIVYQALGTVEQPAADRFRYYMFRLTVAPAVLAEMKQQSLESVPFDPQRMFVTLEHNDMKVRGEDSWYKSCPVAVSDSNASSGGLLVCHEHNVEFAFNERLEMAATVEMTDDATALRQVYGIQDDCFCFINASNNLVDCAEWEAR